MKLCINKLVLFFLITFCYSCATYKTQYTQETEKWQEAKPSDSLSIKHTMYLIGDAGNSTPSQRSPVINYLEEALKKESENSSIIFLGDNIYQNGMPSKEDKKARADAQYRLEEQLKMLDNFKGRPIMLPGNHDWRIDGVKGLKRQSKYVQKYLNKGKEKDDYEDYFLPLDGCSGPEVVELNDDIVVIAIDSQWWLADWDNDPEINDDCSIKNRENFEFVFENIIRKYRNKNIVVAMHHPLYTYGPHGGKFTAKQHLFPLTEMKPKLFVPIPILGSLSAIVRGTIGSRQDLANKNYKDLRSALLAGVSKNGNFIFASGHEHALQHIENNGQKFIVSGSGSKSSPVAMGKGSEFATSEMGYSKLDFYEGGETWVNYYTVNDKGTEAKLVYRKKLKDAKTQEDENILSDFSEHESLLDSAKHKLTKNKIVTVGKAHDFLLGKHNRDLYLESYNFPVLDLSTIHGGLTPVKLGGGNQTNSLRFDAPSEKQYVLRNLTKDVTRFLPFPFNKMSAAKFIVEDNFLSTNPFAPLSMPALADAINVYHTNPKLYYVPKQPNLDAYNDIFGESMNLFEERPKGKHWKDAEFFGNPDKIINTPDLMEAILENNKDRVDEKWMLRTRLFDFLIGDWDRHDDQWAWAAIKQGKGETIYRPIPKDRDQAFSLYDGAAANLARLTAPFLRQLQSFDPEIKSMKWTTWSARLVDRTFLNSLSWEDWEEQVLFIQENLTDEDIERSFDNWPPKAKEISVERISNSIKTRRADLMKIARAHYEFISQSVNIIGSEKEERFEVKKLDKKQTEVKVYDLDKDGEKRKVIYHRIFDSSITKYVNLYGNGDKDEFIFEGEADNKLKIRFIGGDGKDTFKDHSTAKSGKKKIAIYDDFKKDKLKKATTFKDKRTDIFRYNVYDRRNSDSNYDIAMILPVIGFNPDDGLLLGGSVNYTKYGFKKEPFSSVQDFKVKYAFQTKSLSLNYKGDFVDTFGEWDFYLESFLHGPSYAFNFAGVGNNTVRPDEDENYYRVRQSAIHIYPAIKKRFAHNSAYFSIGPFAESLNLQATPGRFLVDNTVDNKVFEAKNFIGSKFLFSFNSVDNFIAPHNGIIFDSELKWSHQTNNTKNFASINASLSFFRALDNKEKLILATQFGTGINIGDGFEFYQMPFIGGRKGLRGYRSERFYGKYSFWQSTDLRYKLKSNYNPLVPITYGLFGSFDHGRVWLPSEESNSWHYSYGGGLWLAPVDALTFTLGLYFPKEKEEEKPRLAVKVGFSF